MEIMDQWRQYVLKTDGNVVTIDSESDSETELKLCIDKYTQGGLSRAPKVWKRERPEKKSQEDQSVQRIQLAFCFMYEQQWYIPKVEGDILQLERSAARLETISDSCWFLKENEGLGQYYRLKNVKNPKLYLHISEDKLYACHDKKSTFTFESV